MAAVGWAEGAHYLVCVAPGWFFTGTLHKIWDDASREERALIFENAAWVQELGRMSAFFGMDEKAGFPEGFHAEMMAVDGDHPLHVSRAAVLWWRQIPKVPEKTTEQRQRG